MKMPLTKEATIPIINSCYWFSMSPHSHNPEFLMNDFKKRGVDINISRGYDNDENANVTFCVLGSPNRMMGFIKKVSVGCNGCKKHSHFDALQVTTNLGIFYLYNDKVYRYGRTIGQVSNLKKCREHSSL